MLRVSSMIFCIAFLAAGCKAPEKPDPALLAQMTATQGTANQSLAVSNTALNQAQTAQNGVSGLKDSHDALSARMTAAEARLDRLAAARNAKAKKPKPKKLKPKKTARKSTQAKAAGG